MHPALRLFAGPAPLDRETVAELLSLFRQDTGKEPAETPEEFVAVLRTELEAMRAEEAKKPQAPADALAFLDNALANLASAEKMMRH